MFCLVPVTYFSFDFPDGIILLMVFIGLVVMEHTESTFNIPRMTESFPKKATKTTISIAYMPLLIIVLSRLYNRNDILPQDMFSILASFFELLNNLLTLFFL